MTGKILVTGQVNAERTNRQGDAEWSSVVDVTSALRHRARNGWRDVPDRDSRENSLVDVSVQAELSAKAGNTIAIECVGGSAGHSAPEESIALIPTS